MGTMSPTEESFMVSAGSSEPPAENRCSMRGELHGENRLLIPWCGRGFLGASGSLVVSWDHLSARDARWAVGGPRPVRSKKVMRVGSEH